MYVLQSTILSDMYPSSSKPIVDQLIYCISLQAFPLSFKCNSFYFHLSKIEISLPVTHPQEIRNFRIQIHRYVKFLSSVRWLDSSSIRKMMIFFIFRLVNSLKKLRGRERRLNRLCDMKMLIEIINLPQSYFRGLILLRSPPQKHEPLAH